MNWQSRGLCRDEDPRLWDTDTDDASAAKAICARCPVRDICAEAGRDEPENTWGGMTVGDRLSLMLLATPEPPPHEASRSCYSAGCRRPECCEANTRWIAEWRHRDRPVTPSPRVDAWEQMTLAVTT